MAYPLTFPEIAKNRRADISGLLVYRRTTELHVIRAMVPSAEGTAKDLHVHTRILLVFNAAFDNVMTDDHKWNVLKTACDQLAADLLREVPPPAAPATADQ